MIDKSRPRTASNAATDTDSADTDSATTNTDIESANTAARSPGNRKSLADFAPVPRLCNRHDGWTPERQVGFIEALADTGSVRSAAHAVNMTPEGAYLLRRHAQGAGFRKAWQTALGLGVQRLEDVAMDRALHGVEQPVYSYGKLVGTRRVVNDALLMFLLRNRATPRFSGAGGHSLDAIGLERLKREVRRQCRQEWDAERAAEAKAQAAIAHRTSAEMIDQINARFAKAHTEYVQNMNPDTRRYYLAFRYALGVQRAGLSLADISYDILSPDFEARVLADDDAGPPTDVREQMQEMGSDHDHPKSWLKRRPRWDDEASDEDDGEDED